MGPRALPAADGAHDRGAGEEPALVLAVGAREEKGSARYPAEPLALEHGVAVPEGETPDEAYARWGDEAPGPAPGEL